MKSIDISNQRFGKLLVVKKAYYQNKKVYWQCLCDCGKITYVHTSNLKCKRIRSCGCLKVEELVNRSTKHNQRHTKLYEVWKTIKQRCLNPKNVSYHNYGGRGITICEEWKNDFMSFYNWSMKNGYKEGLTIDRINNDGNYEPSNCRWTTRLVQNNNTRVNNYITINNETKTLTEWCRFYNANYGKVYRLYKLKNYDIIKALTASTQNLKSSK